MPGTICSVALCTSNSKVSKQKGEVISFFTFPKDEKLRKQWVKKCYRKDKFKPENKRVCSKHFKIADFEDVIAAKLKNTVPRKLKFDAVPSLFLLPEHYCLGHTTERTASDEERELRSRKEIIEQLLAVTDGEGRTVDIKEFCSNDTSHVGIENENNSLQEDYDILVIDDEHKTVEIEHICSKDKSHVGKENENRLLQEKYDKLVIENKLLKDKLKNYEFNLVELANEKGELELRLNDLEKKSKNIIRDAFSDVFTDNQLNIILKKDCNTRWTSDEMRKASVLRRISKRAYLYMLRHLKYPFPSSAILRRWEANASIDCCEVSV